MNGTERVRDVLDIIVEDPENHGEDVSVVELARRAILASGLKIRPLDSLLPSVTQASVLATSGQGERGIAEIVASRQAPAQQTSKQTLNLAVAAYRASLNSPVLLSEFLSAFWEHYRVPMGLASSDVRVTDCPYSENDVWQFMKLDNPQAGNPDADIGFYLPQVLATDGGLILLGKGFDYMGTWAFQEGNGIRNGHQSFGWMRVNASLDAPHRLNKQGQLTGLNVDELKRAISDEGRTGKTVNTYGPSGAVIKRVFNYYPDEGITWSRVPESVRAGKVLDADFDGSGHLGVFSGWPRGGRSPGLGGRSFLGA